MKLTLISSFGFAGLELFMRKVFYIMFIPYCKEQTDLKLRVLRSGKAAFCIYKSLYFIVATSWGYWCLKDQYYYPWYLGGSGNADLAFSTFPYAKHAPQLK